MKRIFSEVQKDKIFNSQLKLLKQDLNDCLLLLKNKSYRSAYIFLFDSLERIFDLFFITKGEKPVNRKEREELVFKFFSPETYRKYRSFYYERRGGMYEDFLLITIRDFKELFKFFYKVFSEVQKKISKKIDDDVKKIIEEIKSI
ncbi:MAG: hypothetical protein NZ942_03600 [Candidatus Aenigmarchaeota archaeon]|nr:hypothetical protein [Candidatus Aenigmarchaeota archaeon]